ncbi:MAG: energy transducer TonB, partial [Allosphingosinicella sp.]
MSEGRAMDLLPIAFAALALGPGTEEGPTGPWRVERADSHCTLIRQEPGARPLHLTLEMTPGTGQIRIMAADPAWSDRDAAKAAAMPFLLDPGGPVVGEKARPVRNLAGAGVELAGIDQAFLATFAEARSIRLERDGRTPFRVQLPEIAAAVSALRDCEEDSLRQWGVDTAARAALRRLPKPAGAGAITWFRWQEYPDAAVIAGASGTVVTRIAVDSAGGAKSCTVVVSAGHPALDKRTCQSILKRARFEPALDSAGKAVRS